MRSQLIDPAVGGRKPIDSAGAGILYQLAALTSATLTGRPAVAITSCRSGDLVVVAESAARARILEETQLIYQAGPGLEAVASGVAVTVADLDGERRWPDYCAQLRALGVRSLHCQPLITRGAMACGVLTAYSDYPAAFLGRARHSILIASNRAAALQRPGFPIGTRRVQRHSALLGAGGVSNR
jgi:GAF domain-containing protein